MKAQVITIFIVECMILDEEKEEKRLKEVLEEVRTTLSWVLHVDDASSAQGSEARLILIGPSGVVTECALRFGFRTTNNEAKYATLIASLKVAKEIRTDQIEVLFDS